MEPAVRGDEVRPEGIERLAIGGRELSAGLRDEDRAGHHVPGEVVVGPVAVEPPGRDVGHVERG